jgi:hypothetical protein
LLAAISRLVAIAGIASGFWRGNGQTIGLTAVKRSNSTMLPTGGALSGPSNPDGQVALGWIIFVFPSSIFTFSSLALFQFLVFTLLPGQRIVAAVRWLGMDLVPGVLL